MAESFSTWWGNLWRPEGSKFEFKVFTIDVWERSKENVQGSKFLFGQLAT